MFPVIEGSIGAVLRPIQSPGSCLKNECDNPQDECINPEYDHIGSKYNPVNCSEKKVPSSINRATGWCGDQESPTLSDTGFIMSFKRVVWSVIWKIWTAHEITGHFHCYLYSVSWFPSEFCVYLFSFSFAAINMGWAATVMSKTNHVPQTCHQEADIRTKDDGSKAKVSPLPPRAWCFDTEKPWLITIVSL